MRATSRVLWLLSMVGASCLPAGAADQTAWSRGSLRVLVSADEEPEMFSLAPGTAPGLEREMIEAFARIHGLRVEIIPVESFDQTIPRLLDNHGDLITGIVDTETRRQHLQFTAEILPVRHVVVTRRPRSPLGDTRTLRRSRVGVLGGTSWAEAAVEAGVPASNLVSFGATPQLLQALRSGEVSATVMSITDFVLAQKRDRDLEAGLLLGQPTRAAWGLRKDDAELLRALNEHIQSLRRSGAWNRLVLKYFSANALSLLARARTP